MSSEVRTIKTNISSTNLTDIIGQYLYAFNLVEDNQKILNISVGTEIKGSVSLEVTIQTEVT